MQLQVWPSPISKNVLVSLCHKIGQFLMMRMTWKHLLSLFYWKSFISFMIPYPICLDVKDVQNPTWCKVVVELLEHELRVKNETILFRGKTSVWFLKLPTWKICPFILMILECLDLKLRNQLNMENTKVIHPMGMMKVWARKVMMTVKKNSLMGIDDIDIVLIYMLIYE